MSIYSEINKDSAAGKHIVLQIRSNDRPGLVSEISEVFSEMEIAITNHRAKVYTADNGRKYSLFLAEIEPISGEKADTLVHRLNKIKSVIGVEAYNAR